jgi:hypothetical protein
VNSLGENDQQPNGEDASEGHGCVYTTHR